MGATFSPRRATWLARAQDLTWPWALAGQIARRLRLVHPGPIATPLDLKHVKVLVVDDDPFIREVITVMLRLAGAMVAVAESATEGFDMLMHLRPDVLVSDIRMPGEDGYSLMRRVRELPPEHGGHTPAIAITAFGQEEDRFRAQKAGFQLHLTKPLDPEELRDAIRSLV
jgi:CheY-like chemotaxis protein